MKLTIRKGQDTGRHCRSHCVERQPTKGQLEGRVDNASDTTASQVGGDPVQKESRRDRTSGPTEPGICPVNGTRLPGRYRLLPHS